MSRTRSTLLPIGLAAAIAGCKVNVVPPTGGEVVSQSGAYQCSAESPCVIDIVDTAFLETFVAVPADGWEFTGWKQEPLHFCGGATGNCVVNSALIGALPQLLPFLDADTDWFVVPQFEREPLAVIGTWEGTWTATNVTNAPSGTISIEIEQSSGAYLLTLDIGSGNLLDDLFLSPAREFQAVVAEDGTLTANSSLSVEDQTGTVDFSLAPDGTVSLSITGVTLGQFTAFEASGSLGTDSGSLEFESSSSLNTPVVGTVTLAR